MGLCASAQPATQQKEEAHQPMCLKHYWSQEIAELPRPIQHPGESLEMKQFILTQCLVFSESEKRVTDKKPTGKVSPPTGSPTPELRPHQCNTTQWPDTWVWTLPCSVEPSGTIFRASLGFGKSLHCSQFQKYVATLNTFIHSTKNLLKC